MMSWVPCSGFIYYGSSPQEYDVPPDPRFRVGARVLLGEHKAQENWDHQMSIWVGKEATLWDHETDRFDGKSQRAWRVKIDGSINRYQWREANMTFLAHGPHPKRGNLCPCGIHPYECDYHGAKE